MQIIYDGRKVQVWEFVSQGLNIGKWSTGKHCDGVAVVKNRENHYVSRRWHSSFKMIQETTTFITASGKNSECFEGVQDAPSPQRRAREKAERNQMGDGSNVITRFCASRSGSWPASIKSLNGQMRLQQRKQKPCVLLRQKTASLWFCVSSRGLPH